MVVYPAQVVVFSRADIVLGAPMVHFTQIDSRLWYSSSDPPDAFWIARAPRHIADLRNGRVSFARPPTTATRACSRAHGPTEYDRASETTREGRGSTERVRFRKESLCR